MSRYRSAISTRMTAGSGNPPGCAGCGEDVPEEVAPPLAPVSVTVTIDDAPAEDVSVRFVPTGSSTGEGAFVMTDATGRYELIYRTGDKGIPAGEYSVVFSKLVQPDGSPIPPGPPPAGPSPTPTFSSATSSDGHSSTTGSSTPRCATSRPPRRGTTSISGRRRSFSKSPSASAGTSTANTSASSPTAAMMRPTASISAPASTIWSAPTARSASASAGASTMTPPHSSPTSASASSSEFPARAGCASQRQASGNAPTSHTSLCNHPPDGELARPPAASAAASPSRSSTLS